MIMSAKGFALVLALRRLLGTETVTRHLGRRGLRSRSGHADMMKLENPVGGRKT